MEWLERFKRLLEVLPDTGDAELFAVFPELENSPDRLNAALLFVYKNVVAQEFKPKKKKWLNWKR